MSYIVTATEEHTGTGSDTETKALLYLMCRDDDADKVVGFFVDVFNDVTGTDMYGRKLWDVRSKKRRSQPGEIGQELVTLYKNYLSVFSKSFQRFILFLGGVSSGVRDVDAESANAFAFFDMKSRAQAGVLKGLLDESHRKTYMKPFVERGLVNESSAQDFLTNVLFVIADEGKEAYISDLLKDVPARSLENRDLRGIFDEIRDYQSSKKNIKCEGIALSNPAQAFALGKTVSRDEVLKLALGRVLMCNPFESTPRSFVMLLSRYPDKDYQDIIEKCQADLARQMYDKTSVDSFWALFGAILEKVEAGVEMEIPAIYESLDAGLLGSCPYLKPLSVMLLIASIGEGLKC